MDQDGIGVNGEKIKTSDLNERIAKYMWKI